MEVVAWALSLGVLFVSLLILNDNSTAAIVFTTLSNLTIWIWAINNHKDQPRHLWRYLVEWVLGAGVALLYFNGSNFLPGFIENIWFWCNVPFFMLYGHTWIYYGICIVMIGLAAFQLIRNHKINKEWW